jgi:hypothetical protein
MPSRLGDGATSDRRYRRQVRRFERAVGRIEGALAERFGEDESALMRQEMLEEYLRLVPQLPDVGGRGNPMASSLSAAPMLVTLYRVVGAHGGQVEDAGELMHRYTRAELGRVPRVLRPWVERHVFSRRSRRRYERGARRSQTRQNPEDWVFEMVQGDGESFDYGFDIIECGIVKFLRAQDADDLAPYACDLDYVAAEMFGYRLQRTKTLAWGCDCCDFRFSRQGHSSAPWPPVFAERRCGVPQLRRAS